MLRLKTLLVTVLLVAMTALSLGVSPSTIHASPLSQQQNLLANPSFEAPYYPDLRSDGGGLIAQGWYPWWYNDAGDEYDAPEFKEATLEIDPYRVRSGESAQQYFREWAIHLAGLYQRVEVPADAKLRFTLYGHAWSSFCELDEYGDVVDCNPRDSAEGYGINEMAMRVGIDPTGGTDPFSPNIVWGPTYGFYDNYGQLSVEAQAAGEFVTVFAYSKPTWPTAAINVYWDDAALVVMGAGVSSPTSSSRIPAQTQSAPQQPIPPSGSARVPAQAPSPDGSQHHTVLTGETLGGIALAYGVSSEEVRALNNLGDDLIYVGQDLLIRPPSSGTPPEVSASNVAPGQAVAAVTARLCVAVFDDVDLDGLRNDAEPLLADGILRLEGSGGGNYTTDGVNEPYCFENLAPGEYTVSAAAPEGYDLVGLAEVPVTLLSGGNVIVRFGAYPIDDLPALEVDPEVSSRGLSTPLVIAIGALALAAGGGLVGYALAARKKSAAE